MTRFAILAVLFGCHYDATLGLHGGLDVTDAGSSPTPTTPDAAADAQGLDTTNLAFSLDFVYGWIVIDGSDVITSRMDSPYEDPDGVQPATIVRVHPDRTIIPIADGRRIGLFDQDATALYALRSPDPSAPHCGCEADYGNSVVRIDKATGEITTLSAPIAAAEWLAVDGDTIYIVRVGSGSEGGIVSIPRTGGAVEPVFAGDSLFGLAVDDNYLYTVEDTACGRALAIPKLGSTAPLVLATNLDTPVDVHLADGDVYISELGQTYTGGSIVRVARPAAHAHQSDIAPFARIVTNAGAPYLITHDNTYVYWTSYFFGLCRAPRAGGAAELRFATGDQGNGALAVWNSVVLFTARHLDNTAGIEYAVQR